MAALSPPPLKLSTMKLGDGRGQRGISTVATLPEHHAPTHRARALRAHLHLHGRSWSTLQDPFDLTLIIRRSTARTPHPELVGPPFEMADLLPEVPAHEPDP